MGVSAPCACLVYPQKPEGELDPLKQELQMVVSHHEDAMSQGTVLCKNSQHSNPLRPLLSPGSLLPITLIRVRIIE